MILTPAQGTSFLLLDQQPVVFSAATQKLYALNNVAALIWCCLEKREPPSVVVERLVASGASPANAATHLHRASRRWLRLGLLQVDVKSFDDLVIAKTFNVSLGRLTWTFQVTSEHLAQLLLQLFDNHEPPRERGNRLKIIDVDGEVYVFHNDKCVLTCGMDDFISSTKAYLTQQLVAQCAPNIALHSACLRFGAEALLISGCPGAGKTTLALHLVQQGLEYCGDDIVLITQDGRVMGVPFAPTIKSGAWRILEQCHPGLKNVPVHRRPDGKRVKYLNALPIVKNGTVCPVGWIVFLKRRSRGGAKLVPLTRLDALKRLIKSSFSPDGRISLSGMISIKSMMTQSYSVELSYANANEASAAILALCHAKS